MIVFRGCSKSVPTLECYLLLVSMLKCVFIPLKNDLQSCLISKGKVQEAEASRQPRLE